MIRIKIEQQIEIKTEITKEFLVSEEVAKDNEGHAIYETRYSSQQTATNKKYEVKTVPSTKTETITLLEQQIQDDTAFDLTAVVKAINKIA